MPIIVNLDVMLAKRSWQSRALQMASRVDRLHGAGPGLAGAALPKRLRGGRGAAGPAGGGGQPRRCNRRNAMMTEPNNTQNQPARQVGRAPSMARIRTAA